MDNSTKRNPAAQCWETPDDLFNAIDREFNFGIDVCANENNAKVKNYLCEEDDALRNDMLWCSTGNAWCNPPYAAPLPWVQKAYQEAVDTPGRAVVVLLNFDSSTKWYDFCVKHASEIRIFTKNRVKFKPPAELKPEEGKKLPGTTKPSVLVVFRKKAKLAPCHVWHWDWKTEIQLQQT